MTATLDPIAGAAPASGAAFGHRLAPAGDPLEGADFDALYAAKIAPELAAYERWRQWAMTAFVAVLALGALLVYVEYLTSSPRRFGGWAIPGFQIMAFTAFATIALAYLPLNMVGMLAKVKVVEALCRPLGIDYQPKSLDAPEFDRFLSLKLLPRPQDKTFQDLFSGRRGQTDFAACEARLTQGSGRDRHTVFEGQMFRLASQRRRASTTVVLRNTGWLKRFECPPGLAAVGLEDPVFNQAFAVFGSDQVEAREILTPTFMQHLVDLETAYRGGHIRCAFDQAELLIALEGRSQFGIGGMFSTLVDKSRVEGIARAIEGMFKLIDAFEAA
jgi:hypothetical protein